MRPSYVIYGTGGHAAVVADLVQISGGRLEAFFDDQPKQGKDNVIAIKPYESNACSNAYLLIGIGNNKVRKTIAERVTHKFGTLVHPSAYVANGVEIGEGTVVLANAVIQANAKIGKHVIINAGVCVDHDAVLGDFVHVYANSYIGGGAKIGQGALINPGAVVLRNAVVAAEAEILPLSIIT